MTQIARWILFVLLIGWPAVADPEAELPREVNAWLRGYISGHTTWNRQPLLFPDAEQIHLVRGDLNGDGRDDVAVLFSVGGVRGGTDWVQYVAVFLAEPKGLRYCCMRCVGSKGEATAESLELRDRHLLFRGKTFVPGTDAYCCPSRSWTLVLRVTNSKLETVVTERPSNSSLEGTRAEDARAPQRAR